MMVTTSFWAGAALENVAAKNVGSTRTGMVSVVSPATTSNELTLGVSPVTTNRPWVGSRVPIVVWRNVVILRHRDAAADILRREIGRQLVPLAVDELHRDKLGRASSMKTLLGSAMILSPSRTSPWDLHCTTRVRPPWRSELCPTSNASYSAPHRVNCENCAR